MTDLTPIINAIIALATALITAFVVPYVKSKTTEVQQATFFEWVQIAVTAAEQIYKGSGRGEEKKEYVLEFLNEKGYKVNTEAVNVAIEAAVRQLTA